MEPNFYLGIADAVHAQNGFDMPNTELTPIMQLIHCGEK